MRTSIPAALFAAALAVSAGAVAAAPINPLALYTFDGGNAQDSSGNGNHGTVIGGVGFVTDTTRGEVAEFSVTAGLNGINTGLNINAGTLPAVTFGGWFKHASYGHVPKVISEDNGGFDRTLGLDTRGGANNGVSAFTGSGVLNSNYVPDLDEWYHAAVVYTGSTVNLYVNGALSGTATDTTGGSSNTLFLGVNPGFNEDLAGHMDDAFVYGRALSSQDITDIYTNGFVAPVPLPAGLPLLGAGLLAFAMLRRRR